MMVANDVGAPCAGISSFQKRAAIASLIGTAIEFYDFVIYAAAAALVFNKMFFPQLSSTSGTVAAFGAFAAGFLARPLGSVFVGRFGDRFGRKSLLIFSILLMGSATFLVGCLPTYEAIGLTAPVLLVMLRLLQGFAVGGEWAGAVLMAVEHAPAGKRGFYGSWPQAGVACGIIIANLTFLGCVNLLGTQEFIAWGWRIPFLLSAILVGIGLYIRLQIEESPVFQKMKEAGTESAFPLADVFKLHTRQIILTALVGLAANTSGYVVTIYTLSYGTQILKVSSSLMLTAGITTVAFGAVILLTASALSDHVGRRTVFVVGAVIQAVWSLFFFDVMDLREPVYVFGSMMLLWLGGAIMFGPTASMIAEAFPTPVRYTGTSIGSQIASVVGGGFAPFIASSLYALTGTTVSLSIFLCVTSLISLMGALMLPETSGKRLDIAEAPTPLTQGSR
jgi:MFS transporter, MHS family, shikimate and dehydroshikimate transport protein